uniref:Reverse transcriptase n=1 Tax=Nicotiana tabacum TaxID=4097 RepID=A0A1S4BZJ8_TOBAC|nr:PREDICTED: uncharacterized protein LOC107813564 [Nicotiana tabacum]
MWDGRIWKGEVCCLGAHSITCKFPGKTQEYTWHLSVVYAPNDRREREEVWWELAGAKGLFSGPWVVCGDLNTVRFLSEKKNCIRITRAMNEFSKFIEDMERVDIQLSGGVHGEKNEDFRNIKQSVLHRDTSDHSPLMLQCGNWDPVKSFFKFENWWLQTEGFKGGIKEWWNSFACEGRPDFILAFKLKAFKVKLKEWSKTLQGNLALQKASILILAELEEIHDQRSLTEKEIYTKTALFMEFKEIAKQEENLEDIKREVIKYYQNLCTEEDGWRSLGAIRNSHMITPEDNLMLQSPFGVHEIWDSVKAYAEDKTPDPDGFSMAFFINYREVVAVIQNFYDQGIFEKSFNATFVALIPKKVGPKELRNFRPISLIGSIYKIISKLLTERLKKVVNKLVDT